MDPTLLSEMLTSLRLIRDEISLLRQEDVAHQIQISRLTEDLEDIERMVKRLRDADLTAGGSRQTMARLAAAVVTIATLAAGTVQYLIGKV